VQQVTPAQVYEQSQAATVQNKKVEKVKQTPEQKEDRMLSTKTLYEVLGASSDATRDELKRQYVTLARATHPDAIVGKSLSPEERENSEVHFTEVAAAWRILSDKKERQRYDRSLKAKAFTQDVEKLASEYAEKLVETAGPAVSQVLDVFFRKTTGTTAASLNAAAKEVKQSRKDGKKVDLGSAIGNAVKAGMQVGRNIDRYELLKKSRELKLK
jgi:DnaJ-class molecular chaperone